MADRRRVREAHEAIEEGLQRERAAALARLAARLEELIGRLEDLRASAAGQSERARARHAETYRALREEARRYRWYLEVQREAVGLRRHDVLDRVYPIPGPLGSADEA